MYQKDDIKIRNNNNVAFFKDEFNTLIQALEDFIDKAT